MILTPACQAHGAVTLFEGRISEEAMANHISTQPTDQDKEVLEDDEDFYFDEEEDDFLEQSQRKLLRERRARIPRARDY
jgi:hypothetical protein